MSNRLNPPQREAVRTLAGPMLVLAGAGTGKTRVVTYRIAELIRQGTPPERILAVTFTRKAAGEMQERVKTRLRGKGPRSKARSQISTFHSLCVKILRRHIGRLGYPEKFGICDRGDQEAEARAALREIRCPNESLKPSDLLAVIGGWKTRGLDPGRAASTAVSDREHLAAAAYRRYQSNLKSKGTVDFDDLLLLVGRLFAKYASVRREEAQRFDHVLVDEYQDTNGSQYAIVKALAMGHRNLCVVGDDDQSIYGWRGADVTHILNFQKDWPEAKIVRLEDNYRSTAAILEVANRLIAFNRVRHAKILRPARFGGRPPRVMQLQDETDEAVKVVADILFRLTQPGVAARDFAILCRTNEQPRSFEAELRRAGVPYVLVGGMSFFDRKEVRDLLAYIKLIDNPHDEVALLRVINTPARGIGHSTVKQLVGLATERGGHVWDLLPAAGQGLPLGESALQAVDRFYAMMSSLRQAAQHGLLADLVPRVIQETGYRRELDRLYPDPNDRDARAATMEEIVNAAASYAEHSAQPTLRGFLDEIALDHCDSNEDKEDSLRHNCVALMTLHSAKGLEFPQVYMVGMEEGLLPHKRALAEQDSAIDEERRLCYVGVTRAQEELTLSFALARRKWGKARATVPSRFLYEMTGQAENAQTSNPAPHHRKKKRRASRGKP
ncbi:MAG: UvrD-helicase domain-containing protein [Pirellulales bacterium]|nr:UvrD-helicase domain-containing protein [Pirellulales bacterium]